MNPKRLRLAILLLMAAAGLLVALVLIRLWPSDEPTYQGKSVSVWFEEYAQPSKTQGGTIVISQVPNGRILTRGGSVTPLPDPAWEALKVLGSNAVPHLVARLRVSPVESPLYTRAFTNLPLAIRPKLPSPWRKRSYRHFAAEALGGLGEQARGASPALLKALKQTYSDPLTTRILFRALRRIHVDRHALDVLLLELGAQGRNADVIAIAQQARWESDVIARLIGKILQAPDPALRREAMQLLEHSGTAAAPALDQIILALKDPEKEVRYLAARTVEAIGTNTPAVIDGLCAALDDEYITVQNVARRALTKLAPDALPPAPVEAD